MNKNNKYKVLVSHFVGFSGVGGVQRNFVEYINNQFILESGLIHKVYTLGDVDSQYKILVKVHNIRKMRNLFLLMLDIVSRKRIVHLYNNLTSLKVLILLLLLPVHNLILHERGTVWSFPSSRGILIRLITWKARLVLSNSNATKTMLEKKFKVPSNKIRVIHNGIDTSIKCIKRNPVHNKPFCIGFIGRLDTPKGVHVLINAMHYLVENNIVLVVAGSGALEEALKSQAKPLENTSFIGRIEDPYVFLSTVDLLVVPSIREPLGNVCLEAGLCKVPVLAANIDGIPEIIENHVSGELIDPTDDITMDFPFNAVPLPEFVVDPVTYEIHTPLQINSKKLADKILELSLEEEILTGYSEQLHKRVVDYFNIDRYALELHRIYQGM